METEKNYLISDYTVGDLRKIVSSFLNSKVVPKKISRSAVNKEYDIKVSKANKSQLVNFIHKHKIKLTMKPTPKELRKKYEVMTDKKNIIVENNVKYTFNKVDQNVDFETDCIFRGRKQLMDHQRDFSKGFFDSNYSGAIAIHGVGTGKTLTAAVVANCYLDRYPSSKVVFVAPAGLITNFQKELFYIYSESLAEPSKIYNPLEDNRYYFYSYERFTRLKNPEEFCKDSLLIIDEAHNLRSEIKISYSNKKKDEDDDGKPKKPTIKNLRGLKILTCGSSSTKILCLTATPFINSSNDINTLMNIAFKKPYDNKSDFMNLASSVVVEDIYETKTTKIGKFNKVERIKIEESKEEKEKRLESSIKSFASYFDYKISIVENKALADKFPELRLNYVFINLSGDILKKYSEEQSKFKVDQSEYFSEKKNLKKGDPDDDEGSQKAFWNAERRYSNEFLDTPYKIDYILTTIKNYKPNVVDGKKYKPKFIVYSNFLEYGSQLLEKFINKKNKENPNDAIEYAFINSTQTRSQRDNTLSRFNNREDNLRLVFLSKAGAEGLSFLECKGVFILEPSFNYSIIEQIIARGVRVNSHMKLPENLRYVEAYCLFLSSPKKTEVMPLYLKFGGIPVKNIIVVNLIKNKMKELPPINIKNPDKNTIERFKLNTPPEKDVSTDNAEKNDFFNFVNFSGSQRYDLFEYAFINENEKKAIIIQRIFEAKKEIKTNKEIIKNSEDLLKSSDVSIGNKEIVQKNLNRAIKQNEKLTFFINDADREFKDDPIYINALKNSKSLEDALFDFTTEPVDLLLLKMSCYKQHSINAFFKILKMDRIKKVENFRNQSVEEFDRKLAEYYEKNNKVMPYKEQIQLRKEIFKNSAINDINDINKKMFPKLVEKLNNMIKEYKILLKSGDLDNLNKYLKENEIFDKETTKLANFFPTHPGLVQKLITLSKLELDKKKDVICLEPTAGYGNIPSIIYDEIDNKNISFDLVEKLEANRKILTDILVKNNKMIILKPQNDFFKYPNDQLYDYVFMNPPFNISYEMEPGQTIEFLKNNNITYSDVKNPNKTITIKDYHFVMRAYEYFCKPGGKVCAILGRSWLSNKSGEYFKKWLEDKTIDYYLVKSGEFSSRKTEEGVLNQNLATAVPTIILILYKPENENEKFKTVDISKIKVSDDESKKKIINYEFDINIPEIENYYKKLKFIIDSTLLNDNDRLKIIQISEIIKDIKKENNDPQIRKDFDTLVNKISRFEVRRQLTDDNIFKYVNFKNDEKQQLKKNEPNESLPGVRRKKESIEL
jgi:hypothetical protein